jgi:hypothetical protein
MMRFGLSLKKGAVFVDEAFHLARNGRDSHFQILKFRRS